jgi:hypothetical protein
VKQTGANLVLEVVSEDAAGRFLTAHLGQVPAAHRVRDSVILPTEQGTEPLSLLSALLSGSEPVH